MNIKAKTYVGAGGLVTSSGFTKVPSANVTDYPAAKSL
jgi:hypothetical protein